jgi:CoA:oxalate CoA-transferase
MMATTKAGGLQGKGPLTGVRVVSLEGYLAGNHATWFLGMLGAEIIKIESPKGDAMRKVGASVKGTNGVRHVGELRVMGNKRSVVIDMQSDEGRGIFMKLVGKADIVFSNQKPFSLRKMGISFESLCEANPQIIYTTLSGFGHDDLVPSGPFGAYPALDIIAQGVAGLQFRGGQEGDPPGYNGIPIGDTYTSTLCVLGSLAALHARDREKEPQRVDVAMHDAMVFSNEQTLSMLSLVGREGKRGRSTQSAPFGAYKTSDGWVNIAVGSDVLWPRFCVALGRPDLAEDPTLRLSMDRCARVDELDAIVGEWTAAHTTDEIVQLLLAQTVPTAPVLTSPEVLASEQVAARQMMITIDDPLVGPQRILGNPVKMSGLDDTTIAPAPMQGGDTADVIGNLLGLDEADIDDLVARGVLGRFEAEGEKS